MRKLFFTWSGIGDNLALLGAAYNYYLKTKQKLLIGSSFDEINERFDFADFISWFNFKDLQSDEEEILERAKDLDLEPVFVTANKFQYLAPKYKYCVTPWPNKHMITRYCEKIGLNGEIKIDIPINIDDIQDELKLNRRYICIMNGGLQKYKAIQPHVMQYIINKLSPEYSFVQVGGLHDYLLQNVIDRRGVSLSRSLGILKNCLFLVSAVGGLLHLARAANCRCFVLQTTGEPECLTYYEGNKLLKPIDYCDLCAKNLRDPQHQPCFYDYKCSNNFTGENVYPILKYCIKDLSINKKFKQIDYAVSDPAQGLEDYWQIKKILWCESAFY